MNYQMCTCGQKFAAESFEAVWLLMDAHCELDHPAKGLPIAAPEHASSWPSTVYKRGAL